MLTGKSLRLTSSLLGIQSADGQRIAVMIPEGATIQVVSGPLADTRMVDILWEGRNLAVFAEDILQRGKEVRSVNDKRSASV